MNIAARILILVIIMLLGWSAVEVSMSMDLIAALPMCAFISFAMIKLIELHESFK